ncbi:MAG: ABC transporter permease [Dictyoglomus sp. NZ13-RE01]|nr:MAG: ABC transporter permease [Dictyoglomus sp. NZ13-RE01]
MKKLSSKKKWNVFAHLILIVFSLAILFPIFWVFRTSLAPEVVAYQSKLNFSPTSDNYKDLFNRNKFGRNIVNSLIVSIVSTILTIIFSAPGAYAIVRYRPGGSITQFLILGTDLLPPIVIVIPLFTLFRSLKLVNTLSGLILSYFAFNIPFLLWMLMGYFEGIPKDLEEAALIDGANRLQTFIRVIFPLAAPGIMAGAVLGFIISWNEFLFALVLSSGKTSTIPVALAALQTSAGVRIGNVSAGVIIAILPMLLIGLSMQKYLVRGLTFGAIK